MAVTCNFNNTVCDYYYVIIIEFCGAFWHNDYAVYFNIFLKIIIILLCQQTHGQQTKSNLYYTVLGTVLSAVLSTTVAS